MSKAKSISDKELDRYLTFQRADILQGKGSISRKNAEAKASVEYDKYRQIYTETAQVQTDYFNALSQCVKSLGSTEEY